MNEPVINRATHFSIVWAVVLAVLTLVEWHSLDRDPMAEQIFLPFIERKIELTLSDAKRTDQVDGTADNLSETPARSRLQTEVEINFDGPLFLVYCFGPILVIHGTGLLVSRLRQGRAG